MFFRRRNAEHGRNLAFVLASSDHGTMIVNRNDFRMIDERQGYGVGFQILQSGSFDPNEVRLALDLLALRRKYHGDHTTGGTARRVTISAAIPAGASGRTRRLWDGS
jgi:hypothetical protein